MSIISSINKPNLQVCDRNDLFLLADGAIGEEPVYVSFQLQEELG